MLVHVCQERLEGYWKSPRGDLTLPMPLCRLKKSRWRVVPDSAPLLDDLVRAPQLMNHEYSL